LNVPLNTEKLKPCCNQCQTGFTLLEILVALVIFAIITTTVFGSFNGVFSRAKELDSDLAHHEMGVLCLNQMQRELKEIFIQRPPAFKPPTQEKSADPFRIVGDLSEWGGDSFGRLRFTSLARLPIDSQTIRPPQAVTYYTDETDGDRFVLKRAVRANDDSDEFEPRSDDIILCEDVLEFELIYLDAEGESSEKWDSGSDDQDYTTPRAIQIKLLLGSQSPTARFETTVALPVWRDPVES